jgi:hypothetical protein
MAQDAAVIAIKAVVGGTMVASFALVGHVLRPKWFAGLFAAAPSVAIASLAVTVADKGNSYAATAGYAMLFGAAGFVAFSMCVRPLLTVAPPVAAASLGCLVWILVGVGSYLMVVG